MISAPDQTFLGIDYGERRIGIAKSDPTGLIASALATLEVSSVKNALLQILSLIEEIRPAGLVIGYPLHESGDKTPKCEEIDRFLEKLARDYPGPVFRVDERYSSVEAADIIKAHGKKTGRDKKRIDRIAATIILQRFLDERER
jgi:putative Holliday junction resolvase